MSNVTITRLNTFAAELIIVCVENLTDDRLVALVL